MARPVTLRPITNRFEQDVFDYLTANLPDEYIVTTPLSIPGDGREIDALVLGPNGVFTIEAKNFRGHVVKGANTSLQVLYNGKNHTPFRAEDPYLQAELQAKKFRSFLDSQVGLKSAWVKSLLVFPSGNTFDVPPENRDTSSFRFPPFIVSLDEAPAFIRGFRSPRGNHLTARGIDIIVRAIREGPDSISSEDKAFASAEAHRNSGGGNTHPMRPSKDARLGNRARMMFAAVFLVAVAFVAVNWVSVFHRTGFGLSFQQPTSAPFSPEPPSAKNNATPTRADLIQTAVALQTTHAGLLQATLPALQLTQAAVFPQDGTVFPNRSPLTPIPSKTAPPQKQSGDTPAPSVTSSTPQQSNNVPTGETGWSASRGGLTLTVNQVERTGNGFRVWMTASNQENDTLHLPLYKNFFIVDDLGNQYEADPFASTFPSDIAPGATVSGYALMTLPLDEDATTLKALFSVVYGSLSINGIAVENIPVP